MHSSLNFERKAGPNRWIAHLFLVPFFQGIFFGSIGICLYTIFTLNYQLAAFLALVSVIQRFAKRSKLVIGLMNKYIQPLDYYRTFSRIYQEQIADQTPPLFCFHPHSVLSYCIPSNMNADDSKMSQMTGLASRFILAMPFIGLQLRLWGIQSVNPKNIRRLMNRKKPIGLVPGGFEQATLTTPKQLRVFIKHRKGFIKYALQHGYTIYPVLCYNEHKAFATLDKFTNFRLMLNKFKIPAVIFGMGFLGIFLPLNLDIINIVGRGIKRNPNNTSKDISNQQINEVHTEYIKELERMHDKYRDQYGQAPMVFY